MKAYGKGRIVALLASLALAGSSAVTQEAPSPVTAVVNVGADELLAQPVGANWTSYNGDYTGRRYSSLREISPQNVTQLRAAWVFHPGNSQNLEATPVVIHGIMYVTSANDAFALDARTGRVVWHHQRPVSAGLLDDAAAHHNRGVAVWRKFVYMETDDAHLLCLDARWEISYGTSRTRTK